MTHPFRTAVEAKDFDGLRATMREDIVFRSPVVFRPFTGADTTMHVINAVADTLEDFVYLSEVADDREVVLRFTARVGDREVEGIDWLELDDDGRVAKLTVFMRPQSAVVPFAAAMAQRLGYEKSSLPTP